MWISLGLLSCLKLHFVRHERIIVEKNSHPERYIWVGSCYKLNLQLWRVRNDQVIKTLQSASTYISTTLITKTPIISSKLDSLSRRSSKICFRMQAKIRLLDLEQETSAGFEATKRYEGTYEFQALLRVCSLQTHDHRNS